MSVSLTFTGDTKDVEKAFMRLHREHEKLKEDLKKVAAAGKQSSREQIDALGGLGGKITSMAAGWLSVNAAVGVAKQGFAALRQEQEKIVGLNVEFTKSLTRTIAGAGDLARGGDIQSVLSNLKGASRDEGLAIFDELRGANPTADLDKILSLVQATAPLAALFDSGKLGSAVGGLAKLGVGENPGDVVDAAAVIMQRAGKNADKVFDNESMRAIQMFAEAGQGVEESLGMLLAALSKNLEAGDALSAMAVALDKNIEQKPGMSKELAKFATADKEERLRLLLSDKATREQVLGGETAAKIGLIDQNRAAEEAEAIRRGMAQDARRRQLQELKQFPAGRAEFNERRLDERLENARRRREGPLRDRELDIREIETRMIESGVPEFGAKGSRDLLAGGMGLWDLLQAGWREFGGGAAARGAANAVVPGAGGMTVQGAQGIEKIGRLLAELIGAVREQTGEIRAGSNRPTVVGQHTE